MNSLRINILGKFEALHPSGEIVFFSTRKAEALLAYLALVPGSRHSRDRLTNLLWSDRSEDQARNSLRQALSALKKSLNSSARGGLATLTRRLAYGGANRLAFPIADPQN